MTSNDLSVREQAHSKTTEPITQPFQTTIRPSGYRLPIDGDTSAIIDPEDADRAEAFDWYLRKVKSRLYASATVNGKWITLHRFILGEPRAWIDHRNGDGLDCRKANLRICTPAENAWNRKAPRTNRSGFKGVHWDRSSNRWRVQIRAGKGKRVDVGYFDSPEDGAFAYDAAAIRLHGEFARLNFPEARNA